MCGGFYLLIKFDFWKEFTAKNNFLVKRIQESAMTMLLGGTYLCIGWNKFVLLIKQSTT